MLSMARRTQIAMRNALLGDLGDVPRQQSFQSRIRTAG